MRAFKKKLYEHKIKKDRDSLSHFVLTSITAMRYDHPEEEPTIKFEHILLFALAGGLVILCALFNYLTLFVNRIRIRSKEIGLRKVCPVRFRIPAYAFHLSFSRNSLDRNHTACIPRIIECKNGFVQSLSGNIRLFRIHHLTGFPVLFIPYLLFQEAFATKGP